MQTDNLPDDTGPVSHAPETFDEGVEHIADILGDPDDPDLSSDDQDTDAGPDDEQDDDVDLTDDEDNPEDVDDEDDGAEDDGPGEYDRGRFAADNAKVKLDDGTTITIAELKRNNLFQRDYTRKTTELAAEREQVQASRSELESYAQQLAESRNWLAWYAETYGPKQPEFKGDPAHDPMGYMRYQHELQRYQQHATAYQQFQQQRQSEDQKRFQETAAERSKRLAAEAEQLRAAVPESGKPEFWENLTKNAGEHYGLSTQDIQSISDHRQVQILRDALAYRRLKAKAPQVQKDVEGKPRMPKPQRRSDPKARQSREKQAKAERLRKTGTFDAGVEALMSFDL